MFTAGFGETIVDILTVNPSISSIPTASAILDASNYTFNAISFGKDANGYKFHAHNLSSLNAGIYNDGFVQMIRYNSVSPSSYHSSATQLHFSSTYSSIPNYPSIYDSRLERGSTLTNILTTSDIGHYLNPAIDPSFSSVWNVIGGYPPSGNVGKYRIIRSDTSAMVYSGLLSGVFNTNQLIDKNGFIKINDASVTVNFSGGPTGNKFITSGSSDLRFGPFIFVNPTSSFSSTPIVQLLTIPQLGDGAALAAFGGINHVGIWCLDLKRMLREGLNPPYIWNALNNNRKYKLVAKVTVWRDLLNHNDIITFPGYKTFLVEGVNDFPTTNLGPGIVIRMNFK